MSSVRVRTVFGIMAATRGGVVGDKGAMPWDYPDELQQFRDATAGRVCIMGSATYSGIPDRFFEKRKSLVVTGKGNLPLRPNTEYVATAEEAVRRAHAIAGEDRVVFMIGGARMAEHFIRANLLNGFILTRIHKDYDGDCRMDMSLLSGWREARILAQKPHYTTVHLAPPRV